MTYTDYFGDRSAEYAQFRPTYPSGLFEYLATLVKTCDLAWDCGTGNGQAAMGLAGYFKKVVASDVNAPQIEAAVSRKNIEYHCWSAEKTDLADHSVDLITIAQALHWFDFEAFYTEARRVAKNQESVIAAWCYSLFHLTPDIDLIVRDFHQNILSWPKEREYVDQGYKTIPFPFEKLATPLFSIEKEMHFSDLIAYLNTWSAVKAYEKDHHQNPILLIQTKLAEAWGDPKEKQIISWPIHLLVGFVI